MVTATGGHGGRWDVATWDTTSGAGSWPALRAGQSQWPSVPGTFAYLGTSRGTRSAKWAARTLGTYGASLTAPPGYTFHRLLVGFDGLLVAVGLVRTRRLRAARLVGGFGRSAPAPGEEVPWVQVTRGLWPPGPRVLRVPSAGLVEELGIRTLVRLTGLDYRWTRSSAVAATWCWTVVDGRSPVAARAQCQRTQATPNGRSPGPGLGGRAARPLRVAARRVGVQPRGTQPDGRPSGKQVRRSTQRRT